MTELSAQLKNDVERALDDTGRPLREVHERMGMWAKSTVSNALRLLVNERRATFHQYFGGPRLYKRAAKP
jgi:hypothetical protein